MKTREAGIVRTRWANARSRQLQNRTELSDEQIVALALDDPGYFRMLYQRYADRVYWYAIARTGSETVADDVVSESMLAALEHLERWDPERGSFAAWLFVIAQRKAVDQQRAYQRIRRLVTRMQHIREPQNERDALDQILEREQASEVQEALKRLPARDREVISLRFAGGLSGEEIAAVLGISHVAARKRLSRAQQRLAAQMEATDA
ncbi:MAG: sigma-70 family RNA polymerase sigma factor [Thermomicrobiales bacterium]